jgi:hypothetical protein
MKPKSKKAKVLAWLQAKNPFKTVYCEDCEFADRGIIHGYARCKAKPIKKKYTYRLQKTEYEQCSQRLFSFCFKFKRAK